MLKKSERRYDIDWLRVLAVLLLIYYHAALPFVPVDWYIKDNSFSIGLSIFAGFMYQWHMPLLFFLSGAATWFSMVNRTKEQYIKERFKRLLIPFVFGVVFIVPPQIYLSSLSQGEMLYKDAYLQFHHDFLEGKVLPVLQWSQPPLNIDWAHLWFIIYLFVFSFIALPLFLFLKRERGQRWINRIAKFSERPGAILLLGIPMATIEDTMRPFWPGSMNLYDDWANFFLFSCYFIYGYLFQTNEKFTQAIDKHGKLSLILAALLTVMMWLGLYLSDGIPIQQFEYYLDYVIFNVLRGFSTWLWVIGILSLGRRYLNFTNPVLRYASEAGYPFYILHQTVMVGIAFWVVRWSIGIMQKYFIISTFSLVVTLAIYELLIRRINILRFLFGMKPKKITTTQPIHQ